MVSLNVLRSGRIAPSFKETTMSDVAYVGLSLLLALLTGLLVRGAARLERRP